tara:strand:- start:206 stop:391 length:186 start_codon:yes stop_codon:yes gene_type:complete
MCLICLELSRGFLTPDEALTNLNEMSSEIEDEHIDEILKEIFTKQEEEINETHRRNASRND